MAQPRKTVPPPDPLSKKHTGHANHICELVRKRDMQKVANMVRDSKYICIICGRTAAKEENLCLPVGI